MPRSRPRVRSPVSAPNLMAGVLRHHGHACAPQSAGAAGMCAAGTPASCSESALWRLTPPSRWSTTAMRLNRSPRRAHASGVEIGRNDWAAPEPVTGNILGGVARLEEQLPCTQPAAGSTPVTSTKNYLFICLVSSVVRVPTCLVGSRGFESRTGRHISTSKQTGELPER